VTYQSKIRRNGRWVIDHTDGQMLLCCWLDCDKRGTTLYKAREYLGFDPRTGGPVYTWYVFCSEGCKDLWVNSTRRNKDHSPGFRLGVT